MADLDRYLQIRSAGGGVFTADGRRVCYLTNVTGVPQAWSVPVEGGWPEQMTFGENRVAALAASPVDAELIVFERDDGGNERMQLHGVRPDGTGERDLVINSEAIHRFGDFSPDGTWFVFCSNARNGVDFDLYRHPVEGGSAERVAELPGWVVPGPVSPDGTRCLVTVARSNVDSDVVLVDLRTGNTRVLTAWEGPARNQAVAFDEDGSNVFLLSDHDGDFVQAYRLELATGIATRFGPAGWDVSAMAVRRRRGALVVNQDGSSRLHLFDARGLQLGVEVSLPLGVVTDPAFAPRAASLALTLSGSAHNPDVWLVDPGEGGLTRLTRSSTAGIDPGSFVAPDLERIVSFDGVAIPTWVYRPEGPSRPPVVVSVHGGPESQELPGFNPIYQYLLSRGYGVVGPNVRGSAGYGRAFLALDDLEKRPDSVADLGEVARWVEDHPEFDGTRMAVMGGSYGGYMVLSTLASHPDLWAAGVDIVGIANLVTFLENTGSYRRAVREAEYGSLNEHRELLERLSPIHRVEKIEAPLLVIHGANDPRVPLSEAEQIVARLRELGRRVELLVFGDEGHGLVKLGNRRIAYRAVAGFLDRHLGN